jgi:hypothetical protein
MKNVSTESRKATKNVSQPKLTIGLDLGTDRAGIASGFGVVDLGRAITPNTRLG